MRDHHVRMETIVHGLWDPATRDRDNDNNSSSLDFVLPMYDMAQQKKFIYLNFLCLHCLLLLTLRHD